MDRTPEKFTDELAALRAAFEAVRQPLLVVDVQNQTIVDVNPAACKTLQRMRAQLVGSSWSAAAGQLPDVSLRRVSVQGERFLVLSHEPAGEQRGLTRDALTGAATREALLARIARDRHGDSSARTAVLFLDLDHFKQVNDNWGHGAGDRVLQTIAQRIEACARPDDLLVRYGGDEFVVLVEGMRRRRDLERLARRILRSVQLPISVDGHELVVSASLGMAHRNSHRISIDTLIGQADQAMYRAKSRDRSASANYSDFRSLAGSPRFQGLPYQSPCIAEKT